MNKQPNSTELAKIILNKPEELGRALLEANQTRRLIRAMLRAKRLAKPK